MNPEQIWTAAREAAERAARAHLAQYGILGACGFAWVIIRPARGKLVTWLKAQKIGHKAYEGGYQIWYSYLHSLSAYQAIGLHEAAAEAAAASLRENGIDARAGSRMD